MNLISQYSGIQFQYINGFTWDQLVEMSLKGEIDFLHSLSLTQEREMSESNKVSYHVTKYHTE